MPPKTISINFPVGVKGCLDKLEINDGQHQFYLRQDYFVDAILKCVQATKNAVAKKLQESEQLTRVERKKAVRYLSQSYRYQREHYSIKYVKQWPHAEVFFAGLIGLGLK